MKNIKRNVELPREIDVNGAAYALVKLQETYNLTLDNLISGQILDHTAVSRLTGQF